MWIIVVPRRSLGPNLSHIFLGAEGTMGIITEVTLKTFEETSDRWLGAYTFANMEEGLKTMQKFIRTGWNPAVTRLHYPIEEERYYTNYVEVEELILLIIY